MNVISNKRIRFFVLTLLLKTHMSSIVHSRIMEKASLPTQMDVKKECLDKTQLVSIIKNSAFALFAQEQKYLDSNDNNKYIKSAGTELLIRVPKPFQTDIYVNTEDFIVQTAKLGLLGDLTEKIIDKVIDNQHVLDVDLVPYFINIPPPLVCPDFAHKLVAKLKNAKLPVNFIGVELTEREDIIDRKAFDEGMITLKKHGISTALDDYGRGWATMDFLESIHVDRVKIDRNTLKDAKKNYDLEAKLKDEIKWMRDFGMEVIAEGIEDADDQIFAANLGCDGVQGYFLNRPQMLIDVINN